MHDQPERHGPPTLPSASNVFIPKGKDLTPDMKDRIVAVCNVKRAEYARRVTSILAGESTREGIGLEFAKAEISRMLFEQWKENGSSVLLRFVDVRDAVQQRVAEQNIDVSDYEIGQAMRVIQAYVLGNPLQGGTGLTGKGGRP